jgi:hypothetical protein
VSWRPRWNLEPCGTLAAYRRHSRAGEKPCEACREARNAANRVRTWRRAKSEAFWRAQQAQAEADYATSVEAWRAEHEESVRRQQERAVRTLVALLTEALQAGERSRAA